MRTEIHILQVINNPNNESFLDDESLVIAPCSPHRVYIYIEKLTQESGFLEIQKRQEQCDPGISLFLSHTL
jgi:hypothetical protein